MMTEQGKYNEANKLLIGNETTWSLRYGCYQDTGLDNIRTKMEVHMRGMGMEPWRGYSNAYSRFPSQN